MKICNVSGMGYHPYASKNSNKKTTSTESYADKIQKEKEKTEEQEERQESKTRSDIIIKPDGSRVLVLTMSVGGMETTTCLEISKPTHMLNNNLKQQSDNHDTIVSEADMESECVDCILKEGIVK